MRKALAIIGMVQALVALAPILAEAAGPMGMAPSRGQSHQFSQNHQSNQFNQSFRGYPFPNYYPSSSNRSNFYRHRYYRPNYYRPYYYYPYYSSYYFAPPAYVPQQSYSNYSGAPSGYGAPQGYLDMAPAPQIEREVFFPEGRYVLLGDGDAVPFRWVWVPNPPTAPPSEPQDQR